MDPDLLALIIVWIFLLAFAFGLFDAGYRLLRNATDRFSAPREAPKPTISEILAMIRDTQPRTRFEEGPDRYVRRIGRIRWPEKYWDRS